MKANNENIDKVINSIKNENNYFDMSNNLSEESGVVYSFKHNGEFSWLQEDGDTSREGMIRKLEALKTDNFS